MKKIISFCRISKEDPKEKNDEKLKGLQRQILDNKTFLFELGFVEEDIELIAKDESGYKSEDSREGLLALKEVIQKTKIRKVVITEPSRLSRKQTPFHSILDFFIENQIDLYITTTKQIYKWNEIDNNRTLLTINNLQDFNEGRMLSQRAKSGRKASFELYNILNKPIYGFKNIKREGVVIDKEKAKIVQHLFQLAKEGKSNNEIKEIFKKEHKLRWSNERITYILNNRKYIGEPFEVKIKDSYDIVHTYKRQYEPLIKEEDFLYIQNIRGKNLTKSIKKEVQHKVLLRKKIIDSNNKFFVVNYQNSLYISQKPKDYENDNYKKAYLSINKLDTIIWYFTKEYLETYLISESEHYKDTLIKEYQSEIEQLRIDIKEIEEENKRATHSYIKGKLSQTLYDNLIASNETIQKSKENSLITNQNKLRAITNITEERKRLLFEAKKVFTDIKNNSTSNFDYIKSLKIEMLLKTELDLGKKEDNIKFILNTCGYSDIENYIRNYVNRIEYKGKVDYIFQNNKTTTATKLIIYFNDFVNDGTITKEVYIKHRGGGVSNMIFSDGKETIIIPQTQIIKSVYTKKEKEKRIQEIERRKQELIEYTEKLLRGEID